MSRNLKQAALRGRIGAYARLSRYDAQETTKQAREKFLDRFYDEVDPERKLPPLERERRADFARKAYFARLALKSAKARAKGSAKKMATLHNVAMTEVRGNGATPTTRFKPVIERQSHRSPRRYGQSTSTHGRRRRGSLGSTTFVGP
jgi:hypothetical protein